LKGAAVAGGEGALIYGIVEDERALSQIQDEIDAAFLAHDNDAYNDAVNEYNQRLDASTRKRWFLGAVLAYALIDAYIDANFVNFDGQFDRDPAPPGGQPE